MKKSSVERENELRDALDDAGSALDRARRKYLEGCGWKYTCDTPSSLWLWEKRITDGRTLLVDATTAIRIQEAS